MKPELCDSSVSGFGADSFEGLSTSFTDVEGNAPSEVKQRLCSEIERALGCRIQTPKDFQYLSERIYDRLHVMVSSTTLKRLWGYLADDVEPRPATLGILARFLGYRDWEDYCVRSAMLPETQSSPVMSRRLSVMTELRAGDCVRLSWLPDRVCEVEYLGGLRFRIVSSENTRLRAGDTFSCSMIIEGEPLYIDNLRQNDAAPLAYVCGKRSGIRFEIL